MFWHTHETLPPTLLATPRDCTTSTSSCKHRQRSMCFYMRPATSDDCGKVPILNLHSRFFFCISCTCRELLTRFISRGATPPHLTPNVWAGNSDIHPYWRMALVTIRAPLWHFSSQKQTDNNAFISYNSLRISWLKLPCVHAAFYSNMIFPKVREG